MNPRFFFLSYPLYQVLLNYFPQGDANNAYPFILGPKNKSKHESVTVSRGEPMSLLGWLPEHREVPHRSACDTKAASHRMHDGFRVVAQMELPSACLPPPPPPPACRSPSPRIRVHRLHQIGNQG